MTAVSRVLFVCEGNICRSPLATVLFRQEWQRATGQPVTVDGAGTRAPSGRPAHELLRPFVDGDALTDLDDHRSRRVTAADLRQNDLVVTMERAQRSDLMDLDPRSLRKVFTLGELAALEAVLDDARVVPSSLRERTLSDVVGEHRPAVAARARDVADPVDGTAEDFGRMAVQVGDGVQLLTALLLRWSSAQSGPGGC